MDVYHPHQRPLKTKFRDWFRSFAELARDNDITAPQLSLFGVIAALIGGGFLILTLTSAPWGDFFLFIMAAACILARLLFDLISAINAEDQPPRTKIEGFYIDFPDRIADTLLFACMGYATQAPGGTVLGWIAAFLAMFTAYTRLLGVTVGAPMSFMGPMAKPQRMATLAIICVVAAFASPSGMAPFVLSIGLWICIFGSLYTIYRRISFIHENSQPMEATPPKPQGKPHA